MSFLNFKKLNLYIVPCLLTLSDLFQKQIVTLAKELNESVKKLKEKQDTEIEMREAFSRKLFRKKGTRKLN